MQGFALFSGKARRSLPSVTVRAADMRSLISPLKSIVNAFYPAMQGQAARPTKGFLPLETDKEMIPLTPFTYKNRL